MQVGGRFHLTYCSNIHAGETWPEVEQTLRSALPRIRERLGATGPFAIGLRLSARAAEALDSPEALAAFRAFLRQGDYYVPTINGFPYGAFQGQRVKEAVYSPDWSDDRRLAYTNRLARILAALIADHDDLWGSISTIPCAFRARVASGDAPLADIAARLLSHAAYLVSLRHSTGRTISLALEPEPMCYLESIDDTTEFFNTYLFAPEAIAAAARDSGVPMTVDDVRRHVGVCLDACHMAVEFEDPESALRQLAASGIRIGKVQLSSGLRVQANADAFPIDALTRFAEDTYLHQVVERRQTSLVRYVDLPAALAAHRTEVDDPPLEWRVHFHVPIFLETLTEFDTTQAYLASFLDLVKREPIATCLEVETYTWDVLPPEYRATDVCSAIARELAWVRARLEP